MVFGQHLHCQAVVRRWSCSEWLQSGSRWAIRLVGMVQRHHREAKWMIHRGSLGAKASQGGIVVRPETPWWRYVENAAAAAGSRRGVDSAIQGGSRLAKTRISKELCCRGSIGGW